MSSTDPFTAWTDRFWAVASRFNLDPSEVDAFDLRIEFEDGRNPERTAIRYGDTDPLKVCEISTCHNLATHRVLDLNNDRELAAWSSVCQIHVERTEHEYSLVADPANLVVEERS